MELGSYKNIHVFNFLGNFHSENVVILLREVAQSRAVDLQARIVTSAKIIFIALITYVFNSFLELHSFIVTCVLYLRKVTKPFLHSHHACDDEGYKYA